MQKSYWLFSLGLILTLGGIFSTALFQGRIQKRNLEATKTGLDVPRYGQFGPVEAIDLPPFRHVVIDYPAQFVSVYESDSLDQIRFRTRMSEINLADFVEHQVQNDTLYLKGKLDMTNLMTYRKAADPRPYTYKKTDWGAWHPMMDPSLDLSIQGAEITYVGLAPKSKAVLFMEAETYNPKWWFETNRLGDTDAFQKEKLAIELAEQTHLIANVQTNHLRVKSNAATASCWITGRAERLLVENTTRGLRLQNKVDTLLLKGTALGPTLLNEVAVQKSMDLSIQGKEIVRLKYRTDEAPIQIDGQLTKYQLLTNL